MRTVRPNLQLILLLGVLATAQVPHVPGAFAQGAANSRQAAEEALRLGLAAQKAGKHNDAIAAFSRAISGGGLPRKQLTLALYRRGISNRAAKLPAQAISDLNSALFFQGDLSSQDRAAAIEERMGAYRDAGLTAAPVATARGGPNSAPTTTQAWKPNTETAGRGVAASGQQPQQAVTARRTVSSLAPTTPILGPDTGTGRPAEGAGGQGQSLSRVPSSVPKFETRVIAPATPVRDSSATAGGRGWQTDIRAADRTPRSNTAGGNTIAGFFTNLFGGSPTAADPKPIVTGGVNRSAAVQQAPAASTAAAGWSPTRVTQPAPAVPVRAAQPARTVTAPATTSSQSGAYEIQVASLRNKYRAEALAQQLMVQYPAGLFASAKLSRVVESNSRSGDVIYAVRYGNFESKADVASMCEKFVADGLDCLVVR